MTPRSPAACRPSACHLFASLALASFALVLAGCGDGKKDKGASQTAAKVNKEEVTVHQINFMLQQQRGLTPDQVGSASKQILELLIDQELAVQRTLELKLDQDPRVMQQLEAARREVLTRAYAEKTGEAAIKPTPEEIKKYYDDKPALFKERRIYSVQELSIEAKPEQVVMLRQQLQSAKTVNEFAEYLKANNFRFNGNQAVRPAEQLPANMLEVLAKMTDGQSFLAPSPTGAQVIFLAGSRAEPVDEARAAPAIEQFLLNDAKRKLIEAGVKAMRAGAKIEYVGKFAEASASAAAGAPAQPASAAPTAVPAPAAVAAPAASGMSAEDISKGLGIKK
jgi:EpsD family peptidyl-prolyl cis-trans isomerase